MKEQRQKQPLTRRDFLVLGTLGLLSVGAYKAAEAAGNDEKARAGRESDQAVSDMLTVLGRIPSPEVKTYGSELSITGVPEQVSSSNLDIAKGVFSNETGLGTESFIAEPGTLLVGPDYLFDEEGITLGEIDQKLNEAEGHVEYFSPVNQEVFENLAPSFSNLPEGGYMFASGAQMNVEFNGITVNLPAQEGHNYFLIVRGLHADGKQDSDLNNTAEFNNYVPGHIEVERYPAGNAGHTGGFISEGQFYQKVEASHAGQTNCGAEGCSQLTSVFVDANTGAYTMLQETNGSAWEQLATNIVA